MDSAQEEAKDHLTLPSPEVLREIERKQNERADEIRERRRRESLQQGDERTNAAEIIQRNYRGYRSRRAMRGYGLDPGMRWVEV